MIDMTEGEQKVAQRASGALLRVFVPGRPAPQGSKRHIGGGRMIESSKALAPWRERVALFSAEAWGARPMLSGVPLRVALDFVMHRPSGTPKTRPTPPAIKRPDADKLARACLDALTDVVFADDSAAIDLRVTKRIAEPDEQPGVLITVEEVPW